MTNNEIDRLFNRLQNRLETSEPSVTLLKRVNNGIAFD